MFRFRAAASGALLPISSVEGTVSGNGVATGKWVCTGANTLEFAAFLPVKSRSTLQFEAPRRACPACGLNSPPWGACISLVSQNRGRGSIRNVAHSSAGRKHTFAPLFCRVASWPGGRKDHFQCTLGLPPRSSSRVGSA